MEAVTVAGLKFKPNPLGATPSLRSHPNSEISCNITPGETQGRAGTETPRVRGAVRSDKEETPKSKSQSAGGEEWEVCQNKKQQINGIIRGTETKTAVLSCVNSSEEWGNLPSHNLAADSRQDAPRKPVWASGRARRAVGGAGNRFLMGMGFAPAMLGGGRTACERAIAPLLSWCFLKGMESRGGSAVRHSGVSVHFSSRVMRSRGGGRLCRASAAPPGRAERGSRGREVVLSGRC